MLKTLRSISAVAPPATARLKATSGRRPLWYAVAFGRTPGIYSCWEDASKQVVGVPCATHQKFSSFAEAIAFMKEQGLEPEGGFDGLAESDVHRRWVVRPELCKF